ncbi:metacaspase-1 [Oryza sativa Japonica Group]|uniref:Metacaspase n=4 Tax=Oryza sativa subsp. japonica TaxID=39947 RepID=Q10KC1_ORYSJ|nr:putative metacaspase [Oryza sativa Japonica Group]ABF96350.1 latex-abundant family protein, putative [Oryza sativa Japonica Group]KAF2939525.1 hypothetical protein DAI22_03g202200 [Oryza sativa Japonica Group]KAF2939526.1 hypothetical protein DAI22_03g202200 [Oryza sativa Japonica Group]KAF2939527.1 hypothetical protein DAI22_03g202200 [Oryza sativa Japonica Group]|eukprot:NP_001050270.1 Os03g0389400 [Oryza sativa Japonica Group]
MASARPPRGTAWCGGCGAYLAVPPGARSVRCALCRAVTRVERRGHHGGHGGALGFIKGLISAFAPPPPLTPSAGAAAAASYYPRVSGKKRALLVGISYAATGYELKGTVNDVNCMSFLLRERFAFPADCILVLTQENGDPYRVPTRANLLAAMRWLVEGCSAGDSLVLHFSGHGVQKLDVDGDEADGYDEALCPVDFERAGVILDDEINETIVRPLVAGVKLHAIVDTCHSGTILDLPFLCRLSRTGYWQWENHCRRPELAKGTSGGLAISISGCGDSQTSSDTTAFSGGAATGAMTYSFIKAVETEPGTTYGRLLSAMRATIRGGGGEVGIPGPLGAFFRRVITFSCAQEPQLCASEPFDIYRKPFLL